MKKIIALIALISASVSLNAQNRILTVDMGEVFNNYYLAQEAQTQFNASVEQAQGEIRQMIDQGRKLAEKFQEIVAKANNPALTEDARAKHGKEAEDLQMQIRRKETEVNNFKQQADQQLAARRQSSLNVHLDRIKQVVSEIAAKKSADLVLNSNGLGVVFSKKESDITKEVLDVLNVGKPATAAPAATKK